MLFKNNKLLILLFCLSFQNIIAQPKVEIFSSQQARPGFGAGIKIKIARNGITGLMRFVSEIPEGCTVNEMTVSSATLISYDNKLSALWLSVPLRDTIFQEWEMRIPETAKGKYIIKGRLEYFENGDKKSVSSNETEIQMSYYFSRYLEDRMKAKR
jgi:hypothetical protein